MRQVLRIILISILALGISLCINFHPVSAQAGSASDLINTVNALRAAQGLAPYVVDSYLMGFAQAQSNYMATLGTWTHSRPDGTTAFDYGIKENVAMGTNMSVEHCVYTVWSDWVHWQTMVGYAGGKVGAGVKEADGNIYYTLNVLPEGSSVEEPSQQETPQLPQASPTYYSSIITSTPDDDGIIIHTVQYGESLWSIAIAYGVQIDEILRNSGLSPSTTEVFESQQLIIRTATDPTVTPIPSATPDPGTATATQPRPTLTPFPTRTPAPTHTPTQPPSILHRALGDGKYVGTGLILVSGLGLMLVVYLGFIKKQ